MKKKLSVIAAAISCIYSLHAYAEKASSNHEQIAVGYYVSAASMITPLLAIKNKDNSWSYPSTIQSTLPSVGFWGSSLWGSGCNSHLCITAGSYFFDDTMRRRPLLGISTDQGHTWSYNTNFPPLGSVTGALFDASCSNETCVSVGASGANANFPLLSVNHQGSWVLPISVIKNLPSDFSSGVFNHVVCKDSYCIASGDYQALNNTYYFWAAVSDDKDKMKWTYSPTLSTRANNGSNNMEEQNLSCSDNKCIIVGGYLDKNSSMTLPVLALSTDQGKTWNYADLISKIPHDFETGTLFSASCHDSTCIAAGSYYSGAVANVVPLLVISHDDGKTWNYSNINLKLPAGYNDASLSDISCNGKICLAGGTYTMQNSLTQQLPLLMITKDFGITWNTLPVTLPNFANIGSITNVKCNQESCIATGAYTANSISYPLLMMTQDNGSTWSYPSSVISALPADFAQDGHFTNFNGEKSRFSTSRKKTS